MSYVSVYMNVFPYLNHNIHPNSIYSIYLSCRIMLLLYTLLRQTKSKRKVYGEREIVMSQMLALSILVFFLFIGDVVAVRTKAWVPSIFISAVLFLIGYWTFFPENIVELAGIPPTVAVMLIYLLITNMGTLLSVQELINQWKTILIALAGILGIITALFAIGTFLFGSETIIVAIPPLVGGLVSALIMSEGAAAAGLPSLAVFAIVIYVMQGFAGYPLTSVVLKKEGKRLLQQFRDGDIVEKQVEGGNIDSGVNELKLFKWMPEKYNTEFFKFFRLAFVGFLAYQVSVWLAPIVTISPFVLCLLFGVIATSVGFLKTPFEKSKWLWIRRFRIDVVHSGRFEKSHTRNDGGTDLAVDWLYRPWGSRHVRVLIDYGQSIKSQ